MMARRSNVCLLLVASLLASCFTTAAKECKGEDLPKDAPLRIGVKHRPDECPRKSKRGDTLKMHYTGKLYKDCTKFDSSVDRDKPFQFVLGLGQVIRGWDQGLNGMCVGEKRKLTIPSGLGYGDSGAGTIPAGATLIFDVELMEISSDPPKIGSDL